MKHSFVHRHDSLTDETPHVPHTPISEGSATKPYLLYFASGPCLNLGTQEHPAEDTRTLHMPVFQFARAPLMGNSASSERPCGHARAFQRVLQTRIAPGALQELRITGTRQRHLCSRRRPRTIFILQNSAFEPVELLTSSAYFLRTTKADIRATGPPDVLGVLR